MAQKTFSRGGKRKLSTRGGKKTLDNPQAVKDLLDKTARGITTAVAEEARKKLIELTATNVYDAYQPKKYDRTYQLIDSISRNKTRSIYNGSKYRNEVYFDINKIKTTAPSSTQWGSYEDFSGNDVRKEVIGWMEEGSSPLYGRGNDLIYGGHPGAHMIKETSEWVESNLDGMVIRNKVSQVDGETIPNGLIITRKK